MTLKKLDNKTDSSCPVGRREYSPLATVTANQQLFWLFSFSLPVHEAVEEKSVCAGGVLYWADLKEPSQR